MPQRSTPDLDGDCDGEPDDGDASAKRTSVADATLSRAARLSTGVRGGDDDRAALPDAADAAVRLRARGAHRVPARVAAERIDRADFLAAGDILAAAAGVREAAAALIRPALRLGKRTDERGGTHHEHRDDLGQPHRNSSSCDDAKRRQAQLVGGVR